MNPFSLVMAFCFISIKENKTTSRDRPCGTINRAEVYLSLIPSPFVVVHADPRKRRLFQDQLGW